MKLTRLQLQALLYLAAGLWFVALVLEGVRTASGFFKPASLTMSAVLLLLGAFDRWIWAWPIWHPWFVGTPDIRGTWRGELVTEWKNPETGEVPPSRTVYLIVRQTLSWVSARLLTPESLSVTLSADLIREADGIYKLVAVYRNEPRVELQERSRTHRGAMSLQINGPPPHQLAGEYWTDRLSRGSLHLSVKSRRALSDYATASADTAFLDSPDRA
jgi:SMODS-associating 2TM, beta-strand rich effector domain